MQEIKFRGKDIFDKKWLYGSLAKDEPQKQYYIIDNQNGSGIDVLEETIGQYTGLHDKNGKEIYEGDIVVCKEFVGGNWCEYHIEKGYVEFEKGSFGLHRKQGYYRPFKDWFDNFEIEVIRQHIRK